MTEIDLTLPTPEQLEEMRRIADRVIKRMSKRQEAVNKSIRRHKKKRSKFPRTKTADKSPKPPLLAVSGRKRFRANGGKSEKKRGNGR